MSRHFRYGRRRHRSRTVGALSRDRAREQGKLTSPAASKAMREILESPDIPHDQIKFAKGLAGREGVSIIRKWGTWQDWRHDAAVVTGPDRHYILVALAHHPRGDAYLERLAAAVDDLLASPVTKK